MWNQFVVTNPPPKSLFAAPSRNYGSPMKFVTTHFNFSHSRRIRETYFEWIDTLPDAVRDNLVCMEAVLDGDDPEIPNSVVLRGTREKNLMWQKEALMMKFVSDLDVNDDPYFGFMDHDMVFNTDDWYLRAQEIMDQRVVAVQCMQYVGHEDAYGEITTGMYAATFRPDGCNPGGPWMVRTDFAKEIGIYEYNVVGGGDVTFFRGVTPFWQFNDKYADEKHSSHSLYGASKWAWVMDARSYIDFHNLRYAACLPNSMVRHLYHGSIQDRQYTQRGRILQTNGFNPGTDVRVGENGLIEWTDRCNERLRREVVTYFVTRNPDSNEPHGSIGPYYDYGYYG